MFDAATTVDVVSMVANVVMAVAATIGVIGFLWWKRQPTWEHGRDVASEVYGAFLSAEAAIGQGIAAMREANRVLETRDPAKDREIWQVTKQTLDGELNRMQNTGEALGEAVTTASRTFGPEIARLLQDAARLASGFRQQYEIEVALLTEARVIPDDGWDFSDELPWSDFVHERSEGAKKIETIKETIGRAIIDWAYKAGAIAPDGCWMKRKLRKAAETADAAKTAAKVQRAEAKK